MKERSYETFGRALGNDSGNEVVRIDIAFSDVPREKKCQIETAACKFLDLAKEILEEA